MKKSSRLFYAFLSGIGSIFNIAPACAMPKPSSPADDTASLRNDAQQFARDFNRAIKAVSHGKQ
ncbi:hypothetical protein AADA10_05435 [Kingella kingae]|uniref:hypothetical protein n=1 Tax=Kingella kingae TaxID=504 RepID=UPI003D2420AF